MQAQALDHLGHLGVATEEAIRIGLPERQHPWIRARRGRARRHRPVHGRAQLLDGRAPVVRAGGVEGDEHRQPRRDRCLLERQRDHRPRPGLDAEGLGEQIPERRVGIGEVCRGDDEQRAPALSHGPLELGDAWRAELERGLRDITDPGGVERVEEIALDPAPVGGGVRHEEVVGRATGRGFVPRRRQRHQPGSVRTVRARLRGIRPGGPRTGQPGLASRASPEAAMSNDAPSVTSTPRGPIVVSVPSSGGAWRTRAPFATSTTKRSASGE